ncbi:hypothetical protein TNCV_357301 [Trichonephila clavipes]|nr:hypothetical protein TNCV_357301 [Trichonephila clavipes]
MFLAGHPSQGCFGLQSHCAPCYFFNQASFYPSDFSFSLPGNEVAYDLAKAAASDPVNLEDHMVLTSTEICSRAKELICRTWVVPPVHPSMVLSKTPWVCHIIQGFKILSDGILAIFDWSPVMH